MKLFALAKAPRFREIKNLDPRLRGIKVKNLLKFISIGLVLVLAMYSQMAQPEQVVQAAASDVAENDIDFMADGSNSTVAGEVVKFYSADSNGDTVSIYVRDKDLNTTFTGTTKISCLLGGILTVDNLTGNTDGAETTTRKVGAYTMTVGDTGFTAEGAATIPATFKISVAAGGATTVAVVDGGKGYADNNTFTVTAAALGGTGAAFTFDAPATLTLCPDAAANGGAHDTSVLHLEETFPLATASTGLKIAANGSANGAMVDASYLVDEDSDSGGSHNRFHEGFTPLVLNSLSVKRGANSLIFDAINETSGTFSLTAAARILNTVGTNSVDASYSFKAQDSYSPLAAGAKRVHVTSSSDATGEWIEIREVDDEGANDYDYDAAIVTVDTIDSGQTEITGRTAGTYTFGENDFSVDDTTPGYGGQFKVVISSVGAAAITVEDGGAGYAADDTIRIPGIKVGGGPDVTFDVATIAATTAGAVDTGIFRGTVTINTDASAGAADNGSVWVQDGDTLTASFYEAKNASTGVTGALINSTTATIDATAPTITNVSPADATLTSDTSPSFSFTIEDSGSGFDSSVTNFAQHVTVTVNGCAVPSTDLGVTSHSTGAITVAYNAAIDWTAVARTAAPADNTDCTSGAARASGGFNVTSTGAAVGLTSSTVHGTLFSWYIKATDDAGNEKILGENTHNETTSDLDLRIDSKAPAATAVTGAKAWSSGDKKDVDDNSSVKITFDESLDSATVAASDFTVSGVGVTSSTIETVTLGGDGADTDRYVYLDLAADLGPNAKPKIKLVGEVQDRAGNKLKPLTTETTGKTLGTSTDGVKPTLATGAASSALIVKDGKSDVTFTSNENLTKTGSGYITARGTYFSVVGGGKTSGTNGAAGTGPVAADMSDGYNLAVTLSNPTSAKGTLKHGTGANTVPMTRTGIFGLTAVGRDAADNVGVGGITKVVEDVTDDFVTGTLVTAAVASTDTVVLNLANWPIADHDGDGSMQDSIVKIEVGGSVPANVVYVDGDASTGASRGGFRYDSQGGSDGVTAADALSVWVSIIDWSEEEQVTLHAEDAADVNIPAGSSVKVTYYYVNPEQVVELDLDAPTVTITPANLASVTDKTPSLSFAWDDDEYAGDTNTTVTLTRAELKDPDGVITDISGLVTTTDDKTFYYVPQEDLALGEFTVTISAKDAGGNEKKDQTSKFTVKDRTKTTIAMEPGWNLVSIPADAADAAINSVITNTQVETVLTYDPSTPGGWLTAVRDGDALVGTLSTIDPTHGYWIFQKNGDDIKVDLPGYKGGASATPPAISVVAGWNLIPVVSLTVGNETVPTGVDKDGYLWGIDWVKAKGWDATNEEWDDVVPDTSAAPTITDGTELKIGKGYWLYSNEAGVIVP
jgi:hypothetical protein